MSAVHDGLDIWGFEAKNGAQLTRIRQAASLSHHRTLRFFFFLMAHKCFSHYMLSVECCRCMLWQMHKNGVTIAAAIKTTAVNPRPPLSVFVLSSPDASFSCSIKHEWIRCSHLGDMNNAFPHRMLTREQSIESDHTCVFIMSGQLHCAYELSAALIWTTGRSSRRNQA